MENLIKIFNEISMQLPEDIRTEANNKFTNEINRVLFAGFNLTAKQSLTALQLASNMIAHNFAKKHSLEFNEDDWIDSYQNIMLGDYAVHISTMYDSIKHDIPKKIFFDWYNDFEGDSLLVFFNRA